MGYCIGGTLLITTLAWLATQGDKRFNSATFMVSMQDFSKVGDTGIFMGEDKIDFIEQQMMERGYLDSREMSNMFNLLRSNDLIWSNVVNNYLMGEKPPAFDLLYWNSDGTRMCRAAHSWYLRNTYVENNLIEPGKITLKGQPIDLGLIEQDVYAVGAEKDHIVPWEAAWRITQLLKERRPLRAGIERPHRRHHQSAGRQGRLLDQRIRQAGRNRRGMARECRSTSGKLVDRLVCLAGQAIRQEGQTACAWQRTIPRPPGCSGQLRPGEVTVAG